MLSHRTDLRGLVFRSEHPKENAMIDTGHVGATSDNIAEATQRIATIVANARAARHLLDHRLPDLDEVRQALDCIVRDAYRANDVIYRVRGLRPLLGGTTEEGARGDQWSDPRRAQADAR
jgi:hypothetical protein